jgi:hypothetical protein
MQRPCLCGESVCWSWNAISQNADPFKFERVGHPRAAPSPSCHSERSVPTILPFPEIALLAISGLGRAERNLSPALLVQHFFRTPYQDQNRLGSVRPNDPEPRDQNKKTSRASPIVCVGEPSSRI